MASNLQELLGEFIKETGIEEIASAIIDFDGREKAYGIHGTFSGEFNSQRAASTFSMALNFLNKTIGGIHFHNDEVEEILVTSNKGYFILDVIKNEKCFQGVAITRSSDIDKVRELIGKYKPLFKELV